jgi:hypothetical protein
VSRRRGLAAAVALVCAAAVAGCGIGPGKSAGTAELRVTRDYGTLSVIDPGAVQVRESDTVLRLLEGRADLSTRYGGRFVQSIDGVEGGARAGRRFDWFFYVDGVESPTGAADVVPGDGEEVWWDYRDWSTAMRVPAVVGAFPEPFLHGFEGHRRQTRIDCLGATAPCAEVQAALAGEGVEAGIFKAEHAPGFDAEAAPTLRVLVGPWDRVGADPAAAQIDDGPSASGVFARFRAAAGGRLTALNERGQAVGRFGPAAGLIAAVRYRDRPPTWVVTGATPAAVAAAAQAFTARGLDGRYAVIAEGGSVPQPVPVLGAGR